jgi:hypothetical protein
MIAEVIGRKVRFEVQADAEGMLPERLTITAKPCAARPPVRMQLKLSFAEAGVLYYALVGESKA